MATQRAFDVPDSTDWLETPLSSLAPVEAALRCQVCKDFFDTPMMTSCSHTFCSLCIRKCLSNEGRCPTCRAGDQELKLRRNWAVEELVASFKRGREGILQFARDALTTRDENESGRPSKKRRVGRAVRDLKEEEVAVHRTRSQSRKSDGPERGTNSDVVTIVEDSEDDDDTYASEPSIEPDDGLVACPMCSRRMKEPDVFPHLDKCTGIAPQEQRQKASNSSFIQQQQQQRAKSPIPLERLPTINYSLYKDHILRKKLRELGIADWGPKPLLERRHREWMNLWNANCDSRDPRTKKKLLEELDVWERTQGGSAPNTTNSVMKKDFDGTAWSSNHDDDFKRLIANARRNKPSAPSSAAAEEKDDAATESTPPVNGVVQLANGRARKESPQLGQPGELTSLSLEDVTA